MTIIMMTMLMEKVNAVKAGGDYSEGIKENVENVKNSKSEQQKKDLKKLNRQGGCGFWGTIGCNRSVVISS